MMNQPLTGPLAVACPKRMAGCGAPAGERCSGGFVCTARWRDALAAAEAEVARLREREHHFSTALAVADGGQYRSDWDGAVSRLIAERDRLRALLAMATAFDVGNGVHLVADEVHGWTFWRGEQEVPELTPGEGAFDSMSAAFAALDRARQGGT